MSRFAEQMRQFYRENPKAWDTLSEKQKRALRHGSLPFPDDIEQKIIKAIEKGASYKKAAEIAGVPRYKAVTTSRKFGVRSEFKNLARLKRRVIVELLRKHETLKYVDVAKEFNVSIDYIQQTASKERLTPRRPTTMDVDKKIISSLRNGHTIAEVGRSYGISHYRIRQIASKAGFARKR